jgi:protein-disulfide isomerase
MAELNLTANEQSLGDNLVTLVKYAKGKLVAGQSLVDYILSELGKASDDTLVADKDGIDAAFNVTIDLANEANAPAVAKLLTDVKQTADDAEDGKSFFVEVADGAKILSDLRALKSTLTPTPAPETPNTGSEGAE